VLGNTEIGGAIVLDDLDTIVNKFRFEKRTSMKDPASPQQLEKNHVVFREDINSARQEIFKNYPDLVKKLGEMNSQKKRDNLVMFSKVQSFQSKGKTKQVQIIKYQDFLNRTGLQKTELELVKMHLVLNEKYDQIFALKHCLRLF
jgi:uncharacterized coiled-coil DUF342 family protein